MRKGAAFGVLRINSGRGNMNWWDYHEPGNQECGACVTTPYPCDCGGLFHFHFTHRLANIDGRCDSCQRSWDNVLVGE